MSAGRPAHWTRRQRLKNDAIARAIIAAGWLWHRLPLWSIRPLALVLGHIAWLVAGRERRLARAQLRACLTSDKAGRITRHMFVHLAEAALEAGRLPALLPRAHLDPAAQATLQAALAEGRGVIAVGGHIGNWELTAQTLCAAGFPVHAIAKPLYDPRLTAWAGNLRQKYGLRLIWRGSPQASRQMLKVFRNKEILGLLIDQDTRVDSVTVPFFGRPARTPRAAAALALRTGAPVVVVTSQRTGRLRHAVQITRLDDATRAAGVAAMTAAMTALLQQAIASRPEQWVWLHKRWAADSLSGGASLSA